MSDTRLSATRLIWLIIKQEIHFIRKDVAINCEHDCFQIKIYNAFTGIRLLKADCI